MGNRRRLFLLVALLANALAATASAAPHPLSSATKVAGKRVDAYPNLWWQWVNRKRWGAQAFQDPTGAQCALNQAGPVWFLAGTDGTDEARRHCRIPSGKYVFLPIITMFATSVPGTPLSCAQAKAKVAANNSRASATEISLDGMQFKLDGLRMAGDCFNAYEFADYMNNARFYFPAASDGYWLMLPPLSKGRHVLRVNARYANRGVPLGELEQRFEYILEVGGAEPPPAKVKPAPKPEREVTDTRLDT
jgi:hypothetical protein